MDISGAASAASSVIATAQPQADGGGSISNWIAGISVVVSVIALLWSWRAALLPIKYQKSAAYLEECIRALQRAHGALTTDQGTNSLPVADRLNWLTAARHIESYKGLKREITEDAHIQVVESHEEEWRHRFYLALGKNEVYPPSYFEPIEPRSALIVHAFSKWPRSKLDPVDTADLWDLSRTSGLLNGQPSFQSYLQRKLSKYFPKDEG